MRAPWCPHPSPLSVSSKCIFSHSRFIIISQHFYNIMAKTNHFYIVHISTLIFFTRITSSEPIEIILIPRAFPIHNYIYIFACIFKITDQRKVFCQKKLCRKNFYNQFYGENMLKCYILDAYFMVPYYYKSSFAPSVFKIP